MYIELIKNKNHATLGVYIIANQQWEQCISVAKILQIKHFALQNSLDLLNFVSQFDYTYKFLLISADALMLNHLDYKCIKCQVNQESSELLNFLHINFEQVHSIPYTAGSFWQRGFVLYVWPHNLQNHVQIELNFNKIEAIKIPDTLNHTLTMVNNIDLVIKINSNSQVKYFDYFNYLNNLNMPHRVFYCSSSAAYIKNHMDQASYERLEQIFKQFTPTELDNSHFIVWPHQKGVNYRFPVVKQFKESFFVGNAQAIEYFKQYCQPHLSYYAEKTVPLENTELKSFVYQNVAYIYINQLFSLHFGNNKNISIARLNNIQIGDLVVHIQHGIGRFLGLEEVSIEQDKKEFMLIEYANKVNLMLPIYQIDCIYKYGYSNPHMVLDKLGSDAFKKRKQKLIKNLLEIANNLISTAAQRQSQRVPKINPNQQLYQEFFNKTPFDLTRDQYTNIKNLLNHLGQDNPPLDHVICADTGFGKTEVVLHLTLAMVSAGFQVALVCPTTILCHQHFNNFNKRLESFNIKVVNLSRLNLGLNSKVENIKNNIAQGEYQVIVGTHAIFNQKFKNLGLLIMDEEHKFGVKQKEKLKEFSKNLHLISLSATPIPRTLQMSLSNLKSFSLINTPIKGRKPIKSKLIELDFKLISQFLQQEKLNNGQSYVVVPHINKIEHIYQNLSNLNPNLHIAVLHAQLSDQEITKNMENFYNHKIDVLLSTNLVESGLDVERANTMVIFNCELFGLAQLYQLRGRVGRSDRQGMVYFVLEAQYFNNRVVFDRLNFINNLKNLGNGIVVANYDLDSRGAGNLLGSEQSGYIKEIGIGLYEGMLKEALHRLQKGQDTTMEHVFTSTQLDCSAFGHRAYLPPSYINNPEIRLEYYQNLLQNTDHSHIFTQLEQSFGPPPQEVSNLSKLILIKQIAFNLEIIDISFTQQNTHLVFKNPMDSKLLQLFNKFNSYFKVMGATHVVYYKKLDLNNLLKLMQKINLG